MYQQSPIIERLWREEAANLGQSGPVIDLGIRSDQLYVAVKLEMEFLRPDASPLIVQGTGFVVVDIRRSLAVVVQVDIFSTQRSGHQVPIGRLS